MVIDEISYLGYGAGAADVLFQVVDHRYHLGKPILFTTSKPLLQWGQVLHEEELAKAIIDRTLHHSEYLKLTGSSCRLKGRPLILKASVSDEVAATPTEQSVRGGIDNSHPTARSIKEPP